MSYTLNKIKSYVDDAKGSLEANNETLRRYLIAYDDHEMEELRDLMTPDTHVSSFWGTVRGPDAALGVFLQEYATLRITWTEPFRSVTSNLFERRGYVQQLDDGKIPFFSTLLQTMRQDVLRESVVIDADRVVFRDLNVRLRLMVN